MTLACKVLIFLRGRQGHSLRHSSQKAANEKIAIKEGGMFYLHFFEVQDFIPLFPPP